MGQARVYVVIKDGMKGSILMLHWSRVFQMWSVYGSDHTRFRSQVNTDFAEYPLDVEGGGVVWFLVPPVAGLPPWMSQCLVCST